MSKFMSTRWHEIILIWVAEVFFWVGVGVGLPSKWEVRLQLLYTCRAKLGVKTRSWSWNSSGWTSLLREENHYSQMVNGDHRHSVAMKSSMEMLDRVFRTQKDVTDKDFWYWIHREIRLQNCYTKFRSCRLITATPSFRPVVQRIEVLIAYCITDIYHFSFGVESHRQQSQQRCSCSEIVPRPPHHLNWSALLHACDVAIVHAQSNLIVRCTRRCLRRQDISAPLTLTLMGV